MGFFGALKDFFIGKDEKPSGPYQSPYFKDQEKALNDLVMGNIARMNPGMVGMGVNTPRPDLSRYQNLGPNGPKVFASAGGSRPTSFVQAGQAIPGQMIYQTPNVNFTQRTPYQYSQPAAISMPDIYNPQYDMARRSIENQGARSQEQILNEINSRGMLTAGAANKAIMDLNRDKGDRLADLASQYSIEQGRMGLQEQQMRRQMEMDRQARQAEEIFRQQGASDAQAQFLAQQSLAGYGANLQGRQQITQEEQLANMMRRQPMEDLFRLYLAQIGQVGGTQATPGLIGTVLSNAAGAGANYGLSMI